jgi:hypothetical protein
MDDFFEESGGRNPGVDDADYDPFQVCNIIKACSSFFFHNIFFVYIAPIFL